MLPVVPRCIGAINDDRTTLMAWAVRPRLRGDGRRWRHRPRRRYQSRPGRRSCRRHRSRRTRPRDDARRAAQATRVHHTDWRRAVRLLKRLFQRLLILGLGILSIWLIVFAIFETADRRLPWLLALGLTYGIAAYIVLPRAVRIGLKILQRKLVPSFTITGDGLPGDPVNIALIGTLPQLRTAFAALGWSVADRLSVASSWRMTRAFVFNSPYPTAPFSTLFLFGRGQDIGFQKAIDNSPRKRHHIRF